MNNYSIVEIRKLLRRNKYTINITSTQEGCIADYPNRVIKPILPERTVKYIKVDDGLHKSEFIEDQCTEQHWKIPPKIYRPLIICEVVTTSRQYDYNIGLVRYVKDGKRYDTLFDIMPIDLTEEEQEQESVLIFLLSELKFGDDLKNFTEIRETAVKYNMEADFDLLLNVFLV